MSVYCRNVSGFLIKAALVAAVALLSGSDLRGENCAQAREYVAEARILAESGQQGRWSQAEVLLEKSYKLCLRDPANLYAIAEVYGLMGRKSMADFYRRTARELGGGNVATDVKPAPGKTAAGPVPAPAAPAVSQPRIEITEPSEAARGGGEEIGARSIAVRGRVRDPQGVFSVKVNDRDANLRAIDSQTVEFWLEDLLLRPGPNDINVLATNTARGESRVRFVLQRPAVEVSQSGPKQRMERWALVVGISRYGPQAGSSIPALRYARRDAETFSAFLRTPQGGAFEEDHILLLTDEKATVANLRGGIRDFLSRAGERDLAVLFFAGHGTPDPAHPNVLYLLTYDSDPERLGATAFDMEEIQLALKKNISARRVVAFVDACHSAGIGTTLVARSVTSGVELVNRYLSELTRSRPGVVMFTASQTNEASWEDAKWGGGHGVFTHFLLEGLQGGADRDGDGIVQLQEVIDFVSSRVAKETSFRQHPTSTTSTMWDPQLPLAIVR